MKITVFYIIFYACLAAFFYLCYQIFATTLEKPEENGSPKWRQDSSLIGSNPGIGFRPMPDQDKNSESTLIWYKRGSSEDSTFWSSQLTEFVKSKLTLDNCVHVCRLRCACRSFRTSIKGPKCPFHEESCEG